MSFLTKSKNNTPRPIPFPLNNNRSSKNRNDDTGLRINRNRHRTADFGGLLSPDWTNESMIGEGLLIRPQPIQLEKGIHSFFIAQKLIDDLIDTVYEIDRYSRPNLNTHASAISMSICQVCAHMSRDMIQSYDSAPLEKQDGYLEEDAAAGDEEPTPSCPDIYAKKSKVVYKPPCIKFETLTQPKSAQSSRKRGAKTSRYSYKAQSMYAFPGDFQQTFQKGSQRHIALQRQDSSPLSHRSVRAISPFKKGTRDASIDFLNYTTRDVKTRHYSRISNLTSPRRKPKQVYEQIPLQYLVSSGSDSQFFKSSETEHKPSADLLRRMRKIQNKGKFQTLYMLKKISCNQNQEQKIPRDEVKIYQKQGDPKNLNQQAKSLTQPLDLKQIKATTIDKLAFTSAGECMSKRDPQKVHHELQKLVSKQKNEQTKAETANSTIVNQQASGFSLGGTKGIKYHRVLNLDQVSEQHDLKTEIERITHHHKFNEVGECITCKQTDLSPKAQEEAHKELKKQLLEKITREKAQKDKQVAIKKVLEDLKKNQKSSRKILTVQENLSENQIKNLMGQPKIKKPQIYFPKSKQNHYQPDTENTDSSYLLARHSDKTIFVAKSKQKQSHPLFKINMEDFTIQKEADPIDQLHQEKTVYRASEGSYNQIAGLRSSVHSCIDPTVKPGISTQRGKEHFNSLDMSSYE